MLLELSIVFIIIILFYYYFINYKIHEGVVFGMPYFLEHYKENNIVFDEENRTLLSSSGQKISYKNHFNSKQGDINCNDKALTSSILQKNNINVPRFIVWNNNISNQTNLTLIKRQLIYPLVAKPTQGTQGYGVKTNITNETDLLNHIQYLLKRRENEKIIVEEYKKGNDYRIMVFNNEIIGVVKRDLPYVMGDGKNNLEYLIKEHKYSKHKIHNVDFNMLREQNVTFETIISSNKKIYLSKVSNYHNGASIDNIPLVNVHPENIEMFKKVNQVLDVKLSGIDFITTNISVPYYLEGVIIEVNERPDLQIHYDITENKKDFIKKYVDKIFKENISYEYI